MPSASQNPRILVLGASGKLGRMLRRWYRAHPPEQAVFLWQYRENPPEDGLLWRPGAAWPDIGGPVDAILALWGVTPGPGRDLAENRTLATAAMELGAALGARRVLHCSSAAVYQPAPTALREPEAGGRINAYGAAKLEMEQAAAGWAAAHPDGPLSCAMRLANVAGADSLFAAMAQHGKEITLDRFDGGEGPWRSYISVPGLARVVLGLARCAEPALPAIVNVAGARPHSMEALARACGRAIAWREAPPAAAAKVVLDTDRLAELMPVPDDTPEEIAADWRMLRDPA